MKKLILSSVLLASTLCADVTATDVAGKYTNKTAAVMPSPLGYDYYFKTDEYHIVNGKGTEKSQLKIIPNKQDFFDQKFNKLGNVKIGRFSPRPSIIDKNTLLSD